MTTPQVSDIASQAAAPLDQEERDQQTARLLREQDQDGLRQLLQDHSGTVRRRLQKEFGDVLDEHQIDDAMSQAAHNTWRHCGLYQPAVGSLRAWYLTIARNVVRRMLRAHPITVSYRADLDSAVVLPAMPPHASIQAGDELAQLHYCIRTLPLLQRQVMLADLAAGGSAPAATLAQELDTSVNSIYASRTQARAALRIAMRAWQDRSDADTSAMEAVE